MRSIIREIASEIHPVEGRLIDLQGDIAVYLSRILSSRGITQRQLATRTGMTEPRISKILAGDENLTLRTIVRLELATETELIESPMFRSQAPAVVKELATVGLQAGRPDSLYPVPQERNEKDHATAIMLGTVACYARSAQRRKRRA